MLPQERRIRNLTRHLRIKGNIYTKRVLNRGGSKSGDRCDTPVDYLRRS